MIQALKKYYFIIIIFALIIFIVWRMLRPLNIFLVDERFAWPINTQNSPLILADLSSKQCASCHPDFYREWQTTIHAQAWKDSYFQTDWQFDGSQHNCRLCHTPLDRQQPQKVLAYRDTDKWDPVLTDNPNFNISLQHEGVTCAACHYRNGKIVGVLDNTDAPHQIQILDDPNQICVRCHVVEGERWDTFFRFPPCGTVAEIRSTQKNQQPTDTDTKNRTAATGRTGETSVKDYRSLGCVECHMPLLARPLVAGGETRLTRQHLWRGGHDPEIVKKATSINFSEYKITNKKGASYRTFSLMITNVGAEHYVPTGTPDRHLTVQLRLLDAQDNVLDEEVHTIKRTVMWRPFIVDLWDTRLPRWQPRYYEIEVKNSSKAVKVEAVVKYHLLDESRQQRIAYKNKKPINYEIFHKQILLIPDGSDKQQ